LAWQFGRDTLTKSIIWKVGNGNKNLLLAWQLDRELQSPWHILDLNLDDVPHPLAKVNDFINQNVGWIFPNSHKFSKITVTKKIQEIGILIPNTSDFFCWSLNSIGEFSTESPTWLAHNYQPYENFDWLYKWIWKIDTVSKIKIFLWQLCHDTLLVRGDLIKRGFHIKLACSLCLDDIKSTDHLFKNYRMAKNVWELAGKH